MSRGALAGKDGLLATGKFVELWPRSYLRVSEKVMDGSPPPSQLKITDYYP